jgi:hypothetical protein
LTIKFDGSRSFDETTAGDVKIEGRRRSNYRTNTRPQERGLFGGFDHDFKLETGSYDIELIAERHYDSQERNMTLDLLQRVEL